MSSRTKRAQHSSETGSSSRTSANPTHDERHHQRSASPFNVSRSEEKEELAELNDRLASYIDYVRKLEADKDSLKRKIRTFTEERMGKNDDSRNTYESEIASLRRLVDDLAKQKAAADVEAEKHKDDAKTALSKLAKRETDARNLQRRVDALERDLSVYRQDHDNYEALRPEYEALEKKCANLRRDLDAETVHRSDLENKVAGLRDELNFKNRLLDEERAKIIEKTIMVESEIEDKKAAEYQSKLYDELQAYRDQTAEDLLNYKNEMEQTFEDKLNQLRAANTDAAKETDRLRNQLLIYRKRTDDAENKLNQKEAELDLLRRRVDELERLRRHERDDYEKSLAAQRDELARLQRELELRFSEFADLMNTKVALDQEILMYRKMLEGEESRLNITTPQRAQPTGSKRRRPATGVIEEEDDEGIHSPSSGSIVSGSESRLPRVTYRIVTNSTSNIEFVADQNELGKCVKLVNTSEEETNLGSWTLKQNCDGHEVTFKFPRSLILKPGDHCQVWNSDSGAVNNPPKDLVMKNQSFKMGANMKFSLIGADKEEQANCQITRETGITTTRFPRTYTTIQTEEKCALM